MAIDGIAVANAIAKLHDRGYADANARLMSTMARDTSQSMARRLRELDREARRLRNAGKKLSPDNAYYTATVHDFEKLMRRQGERMVNNAPHVMSVAARRSDQAIRIGIGDFFEAVRPYWNTVDPETVVSALGYLDNRMWAIEVSHYVKGSVDTVNKIAERGFIQNLHPVKVAADLRHVISETQLSAAQSLMRTLYLESARKAQAVQQNANREIITRVIRVETLDRRTCAACVGLHGTVVWERQHDRDKPVRAIDEHHQGRGTTIVEVDGAPVQIEMGDNWFARQPENVQRAILRTRLGFDAFKAGQVKPSDFIQPYKNDVFGDMVRQSSVRQALKNARRRGTRSQRTERSAWPLKDNEVRAFDGIASKLSPEDRRDLGAPLYYHRGLGRSGENYASKLSSQEREVLRLYTGHGYRRINAVANGVDQVYGTPLTRREIEQARKDMREISTVLGKYEGKHPTLVWRGMRDGDGSQIASKVKSMKPGQIWVNDGFTSTSLRPDTAQQFGRGLKGVIMEIKPKGRNAAYIEGVTGVPDEHEYLMNRGAKFRFLGSREIRYKEYFSGNTEKMTVYQFEEA